MENCTKENGNNPVGTNIRGGGGMTAGEIKAKFRKGVTVMVCRREGGKTLTVARTDKRTPMSDAAVGRQHQQQQQHLWAACAAHQLRKRRMEGGRD